MQGVEFIAGQQYTIRGFAAAINKSYRNKLISMGLIPGQSFFVVRFAPFGDTLQIKINDFSLSLRGKELQNLLTERV